MPSGRKPRQCALVPRPQAQGQRLRLSAGSLPTLGAPPGLATGEAGPGPPGSLGPTDATPEHWSQSGQHALLPLTPQSDFACGAWVVSALQH